MQALFGGRRQGGDGGIVACCLIRSKLSLGRLALSSVGVGVSGLVIG